MTLHVTIWGTFFSPIWKTIPLGTRQRTNLPLHDPAHVQARQEGEQLAVGSHPQLLLGAALQRGQEVDAEEEEGQRGHRVGSQKAVLQQQGHHAAHGDKVNKDLNDSVR